MNRTLLRYACLLALLGLSVPSLVLAEVRELVITAVESPTFEGKVFGPVGRYERLQGYAVGELDLADPLNAGIVNIDKAPRNAAGRVEYRVDIDIIKPVDLHRGNGWLFYDVLNRGRKLAIRFVNNGGGGNDPRLAEDVGTGYLLNEGYTLVWSAWQGDITPGGGRLVADFPIATNPDGTPIVGLSREEYIDASTSGGTLTESFEGSLSYPAATLDPAQASLTVRLREQDPRQTPPGLDFTYIDAQTIRIHRPDDTVAFDGGAIYEFIYPAKDPMVMGIGFAATRDVNSFLRYASTDALGNANPLAPGGMPAVTHAMAIGISQSGRFLRDLIYQGFNQDEAGRQVFDGAVPIIAGSRKTFTNYAFAQPGRYSRQHEQHLYPGDQFPFTYGTLFDPISGRTDGILLKCQATGTCPKVMHTDTDTEIWQARGSLVVTDTLGNDIVLPDNVRAFLFTSAQHGPAGTPSRGICQQLSNPLNYRPLLRAVITALHDWAEFGVEPPATRYASHAAGTLVPSDQASTGFPSIPGVTYNGLYNPLTLNDHSVQPPAEGPAYPVFVTKLDADGNSLSGVRHPMLTVPTATHTGWNLRRAGFAENELCSLTGSYIPFAETRAERLANGDPRLSIEERYGNHGRYVSRLARAAQALVGEGLLLQEDAARLTTAAAHSAVGK